MNAPALRIFSRLKAACRVLLLGTFLLTCFGAIASIFFPKLWWTSLSKENRLVAIYSGYGQVGFTYLLLMDNQARDAEIACSLDVALRCYTYWPQEPSNKDSHMVALVSDKPLLRWFRLRTGAIDPRPYSYIWLDLPMGAEFNAQQDTRSYDPKARQLGTMGPFSFFINCQVSYWLAALLLAWPAWRALRTHRLSWKEKRRLTRGLCPTCGYDLRAQQAGDKCPECGSAIHAPVLAQPSGST